MFSSSALVLFFEPFIKQPLSTSTLTPHFLYKNAPSRVLKWPLGSRFSTACRVNVNVHHFFPSSTLDGNQRAWLISRPKLGPTDQLLLHSHIHCSVLDGTVNEEIYCYYEPSHGQKNVTKKKNWLHLRLDSSHRVSCTLLLHSSVQIMVQDGTGCPSQYETNGNPLAARDWLVDIRAGRSHVRVFRVFRFLA